MGHCEKTFDLSFRVVVHHDGQEWNAHALELDIVGCGGTPEEAWSDLAEAIESQVSFALQSGDASLIWRDAPEEVASLWGAAERNSVDAIFSPRRAEGGEGGPLAKFFALSGRRLDDLRRTPLEAVARG